MWTLEQAIVWYKNMTKSARANGYKATEEINRQLAAWLRELQERRKAPEIVRCGECRFNDGTAYCVFHFRDVKGNDFCSWAERRTDE